MKKIIVVFALLFVSACASIPLKQQAAGSLQASETALGSAQDFERALCFNAPATEQGGHCTNPIAATVGLTDARHQGISSMFAQAFAIEIKASAAIKAWTSGQPAPATLTTYIQDISNLLTLAKALDPGAAMFLSYVQSAVTSAQQIAAMVGA